MIDIGRVDRISSQNINENRLPRGRLHNIPVDETLGRVFHRHEGEPLDLPQLQK